MREAAEALDHIVVLLRKTEQIFVAERDEQQPAPLVGNDFAVLEGHVEEAAFLRLQLVIELAVDRVPGDRQRQVIGRELLGEAAEHVARKLVEQDPPASAVSG